MQAKCILAWAMLVAALTFLPGCLLQSEQPLYEADDKAWISELVGGWTDAEGNSLRFTSPDLFQSQWYTVTIGSKDQPPSTLRGRATVVGGANFIDLSLAPVALEGQPAQQPAQAHFFLLVDATEKKLTLSAIDLKWATDYLSAHPDELKHRMVVEGDDEDAGRYPILTAETADLRKFLAAHIEDGIFTKAAHYTKLP